MGEFCTYVKIWKNPVGEFCTKCNLTTLTIWESFVPMWKVAKLQSGEFCTNVKIPNFQYAFCAGRNLYPENFVPGGFCNRRVLSSGELCPGEFCPWRVMSRESFQFLLESIVPGDICPWRVLFRENFLLESNVRRVMSGREKSGRVL